jgi:hypothetical protein
LATTAIGEARLLAGTLTTILRSLMISGTLCPRRVRSTLRGP